MSDFTHGFWAWYVGLMSVLSIVACAWLLWVAGKAKVAGNPGQTHGNDNTTGHVWDEDLRELNNPLPRWWMWLFILTVVFSLAYLAVFPGLGSYKGLVEWTASAEHKQDVTQLRQQVAPLYAQFAAQSVEDLSTNRAALALGESLFLNNCALCHASDGRGSKSFPNLTNASSAWMGERGSAHIVQTVTKGRIGQMPPMAAAVGGEAELSEVAHYVLSLSKSPHNEIKAASGKKHFTACAACHGVDGRGNKALGAPNLTDDYWLHGWGEATIVNAIRNGITNAMPAQDSKLTAEQIRVLAGYVLSLSASTVVAPEAPTNATSAPAK